MSDYYYKIWINIKVFIDTWLGRLYNYSATGIKSGFVITINSVDNTKIDISSGTACIVNNSNPDWPIFTSIIYNGITGLNLTYLTSANATYLAVNNKGTIIQQTTTFTSIQRRSYIIIGAVIHSNRTYVNAINNMPDVALDVVAQLNDLLDSLRNFNISGNIISANGANLKINKSAGSLFKKGSNFKNNNLNPHIVSLSGLIAPATLRYRLQDGTEYSDTDNIDPDYYDNAGVKTSILPNKWSIQRFTLFPSNLIRIQYGQLVYGSKSEAIQGITTEPFITEQNIADNGLLRCLLVVKCGTTDLSDTTDAMFFEVDRFGSLKSTSTGSGTAIFQQVYNNSITKPQIITDSTLGSIQNKRGSSADSDIVYEIINGSDVSTFSITGAGDVKLTNYIESTNFKITTEGGFAIKWTSGEALNQGECVYISQSDGKIYKTPLNGNMPIGFVYNNALINSNVWIVVSGIAYVLPDTDESITRGYVIYTSGEQAGRVDSSSTVPVSEHWQECGHALETSSGNGALTKAILHFN